MKAAPQLGRRPALIQFLRGGFSHSNLPVALCFSEATEHSCRKSSIPMKDDYIRLITPNAESPIVFGVSVQITEVHER
jgi:hypothetical protein